MSSKDRSLTFKDALRVAAALTKWDEPVGGEGGRKTLKELFDNPPASTGDEECWVILPAAGFLNICRLKHGIVDTKAPYFLMA